MKQIFTLVALLIVTVSLKAQTVTKQNINDEILIIGTNITPTVTDGVVKAHKCRLPNQIAIVVTGNEPAIYYEVKDSFNTISGKIKGAKAGDIVYIDLGHPVSCYNFSVSTTTLYAKR